MSFQAHRTFGANPVNSGRLSTFQDQITIHHQGPRHSRGYFITCSQCEERDVFTANTRSGKMNDALILKAFQRRGWVIGKTRENDICPECIKLQAEHRKADAERRGKAKAAAQALREEVLLKAREQTKARAREAAKSLIDIKPIPTIARELAAFRADLEASLFHQETLEALALHIVDELATVSTNTNRLTKAMADQFLSGNTAFLERPKHVRSFSSMGFGTVLAGDSGKRIQYTGRMATINYDPETNRVSIRLSDELAKSCLAHENRAVLALGSGGNDGEVALIYVEDGNKITNLETTRYHVVAFTPHAEHDIPEGTTICPFEVVRDDTGKIEGIALRYREASEAPDEVGEVPDEVGEVPLS